MCVWGDGGVGVGVWGGCVCVGVCVWVNVCDTDCEDLREEAVRHEAGVCGCVWVQVHVCVCVCVCLLKGGRRRNNHHTS